MSTNRKIRAKEGRGRERCFAVRIRPKLFVCWGIVSPTSLLFPPSMTATLTMCSEGVHALSFHLQSHRVLRNHVNWFFPRPVNVAGFPELYLRSSVKRSISVTATWTVLFSVQFLGAELLVVVRHLVIRGDTSLITGIEWLIVYSSSPVRWFTVLQSEVLTALISFDILWVLDPLIAEWDGEGTVCGFLSFARRDETISREYN